MMSKIIPIILTGGSGTRLWPLSRASKPKQFLSFGEEYSLFQQTLLRCKNDCFDEVPIIVGSKQHRFLIAEDVRDIGFEADIILEPIARNSCAAIAAGCLAAIKRDPDAIVMILAADHHIHDVEAFAACARVAAEQAKANFLITFGIKPHCPATGYGYIKPGDSIQQDSVLTVDEFCEKPEVELAEEFVANGYLWNSGNFLFKATFFLDELNSLEPEIFKAVEKAFNNASIDLDFLHLSEPEFADSPSISVDYAVMERTQRAAVCPVSYPWSDLGTWQSIQEANKCDENGNVAIGDTAILDSANSLVHSEHALTTLVGVNNLIVVNTKDALLVCDRSKSEDIKLLVDQIKSENRKEATEALKMFRPWGNYEQLDIGEGYQVKRIVVNPGGVLSLQKHKHRAEHWVVVEGEAEVTIDESISILKPNQSVYVPLGSVHRLANRTKSPVVLIEVQTGSYLGEDDIIRLEDYYNRTTPNQVGT